MANETNRTNEPVKEAKMTAPYFRISAIAGGAEVKVEKTAKILTDAEWADYRKCETLDALKVHIFADDSRRRIERIEAAKKRLDEKAIAVKNGGA